MRNFVVSAAGAVFIAATIAWFGSQPAGAASEQIDAGSDYFCEPSFENGVCTSTVTVGDTVTWTNVEGFHTVTECDETYAICPVAGGFDSGVMEPPETFSQTFSVAGEFPYYCAIHPISMRGAISVVAAPTDTPTPTPEVTASASPTPDTSTTTPPTASPASVPNSGGEPVADSLPLQALVLALGGALAAAGAASLYAARRR